MPVADGDPPPQRVLRSRVTVALATHAVFWIGVLIVLCVRAALASDEHVVEAAVLIGVAGLWITSLGLVVIQSQWAASRAPNIGVVRRLYKAPSVQLRRATGYFRTMVSNRGEGLARVRGVRFEVPGEPNEPAATLPFERLVETLEATRIVAGTDYHLARYTPGSSLAAGDERLFFECAEDLRAVFLPYVAVVEYSSPLGGVYEKRFSLVPPPGAPMTMYEDGAAK